LDYVADGNAVMQKLRYQSVPLDTYAVDAVRGRDGKRVGADHGLFAAWRRHANRQVLLGGMRQKSRVIAWLQVERADRFAFLDDPGNSQRAPLSGKFSRAQPVGSLRPVARHQGTWGPTVLLEAPTQSQGIGAADDPPGLERPESFGPLKGSDLGG